MTKKQSEYYEKLKDPRWQKKRFEVFERDAWRCRFCGCTDETLTVHHLYYNFDLEPWEYVTSSLITLCVGCHEEEQQSYRNTINTLKTVFGQTGFTSGDILDVAAGLDSYFSEHSSIALPPWDLSSLLYWLLNRPEEVLKIKKLIKPFKAKPKS